MIKYNFFKNGLFRQSKIFSNLPSHQKQLTRQCTIRRAFLYVPGSDTKKLEKALHINTDCIVMDCEDGVAQNQKDLARENIRKFLDSGPVTKSNPEWVIRVNPVQTPELIEAELEAFLSAKNLPIGICLPKLNSVDQLQWFSEKVWNLLIKRPEEDRGPLKLILLIESPIAVMTLPELCKKALDLSTMAPIMPVALVFGNDDLLASLGASRTPTGIELLYARQKVVLVAKAFGLQAIDMVYLNYSDHKGFKDSCTDGFILGFNGKQVIHPTQAQIAMETFVPSRAQILKAKGIVKAFEENQKKGKGAFSFENEMIDMPTFKQAENILNMAKAAGKLEDSSENN